MSLKTTIKVVVNLQDDRNGHSVNLSVDGEKVSREEAIRFLTNAIDTLQSNPEYPLN